MQVVLVSKALIIGADQRKRFALAQDRAGQSLFCVYPVQYTRGWTFLHADCTQRTTFEYEP